MVYKSLFFWIFICLTLAFGLFAIGDSAGAAEIELSWTDNSDNELGFRIERKIGNGSYQQHATVGANTVAYSDAALAASTTYCYRVVAYNGAGSSAYSNENCATVPAATFALAISRTGTGSGTVTSSPAGIACGNDCSETLDSGTVVTLSAVAAAGSVFTGWSGHADCADGNVTLNGAVSCTATFTLSPRYTLTTSIVKEITATGQAGGRVVSSPVGIDCGTDCTETYNANTSVVLTPVPAASSTFSGWTGHADCSDGSLTMNADKSCTANFALKTTALTVATSGQGNVTSTPAGIACGSQCSYSFVSGTTVSLRAAGSAGSTFTGWSGGGCTGTNDCTLVLSAATSVTANFSEDAVNGDRIGIYRPATGEWLLDRNGNRFWDGCEVDTCAQPFAGVAGVPVVGDWTGTGRVQLGLFISETAEWRLDSDQNGIFAGCESDTCFNFGSAGDIPLVGKWSVGSMDSAGTFRPSLERWRLDANRNWLMDACTKDKCLDYANFRKGDIPVVGDWTGSGKTRGGFFRPASGDWYLDRSGNGAWDQCKKDTCIDAFGGPGDIPVTGDWSGTGTTQIGVFRPATGEWFLDANGNRKWDAGSDLYISNFGQPGDVPVTGRW